MSSRYTAQLPLDVGEQLQILLHQHQPLRRRSSTYRLRQRLTDAERVGQLQPEPALRIERLAEILLERLEAAGRPQRRFALLGALREPRADRQHVGFDAEQVPRGVPDEGQHLVELRRVPKMSTLFRTMTIFLPQSRMACEEDPLGLGERPIGRGDEQDQIRARDEIGGQPLVLADDGVGPGRVDDVDVAQQFDRRGHDLQTVWHPCRARRRRRISAPESARWSASRPPAATGCPSSALMKALFPALNSPTITSRNSSSSCGSIRRAAPDPQATLRSA